jgi:hypothetical protein
MHVSLSTLTANGGSGAAAIATYYTRGINARAVEIGIDELTSVARYYTGEHPSHGGPVARWYGGSVASLGLVAGAPVDPSIFAGCSNSSIPVPAPSSRTTVAAGPRSPQWT